MPRAGLRKVRRYSDEFKLSAVRLSKQPGLQVQAVAAALEIHPFMLSKWRKDARDGRLRGRGRPAAKPGPVREIARLQALEKEHALLVEEHDLLRKAIRFCPARVLVEYDNTQGGANHIHSVWPDLENDFGGDLLRRHYARQPHGH